MKNLISLMLVLVTVLSLTAGLTACGNKNADKKSDTASNPDSATDNSSNKTSSFMLNGISFSISGGFEKKAEKENLLAISNGEFSITVSYNGESSYTSQEEIVKSMASSMAKYDPSRTIEVGEKNGVFYYTFKDGEYDHITAIYLVNGVSIDFTSTNFSDDAINAITSVKF